MSPNSKSLLPLVQFRILGLRRRIYTFLLRKSGMHIGEGSRIARCAIAWPRAVSVGERCQIEAGWKVLTYPAFPSSPQLMIGDDVFIGGGTRFNLNTRVTIGNDSLIAAECLFADSGHEIVAHELVRLQPLTTGEIHVGRDVWLGSRVTVLGGVVIGDGAVVGAGSLVRQDIGPNEIWAGVPARFIRRRT